MSNRRLLLTATVLQPVIHMALPIPGSRLNARKSPGAHPLCKRQPLKNFTYQMNCENLTKRNFFALIIFSMKIYLQYTLTACKPVPNNEYVLMIT